MSTVSASGLTGKAATQERILQAAMNLFLETGYEKTTMTQVAEAAGVSRATVFWHFSDKMSLFREAFSRLVSPFRMSLEHDFGDLPPVKRLGEQIAVYRDFVGAQEQSVDAFVRWAAGKHELRTTVITTLLDLHQRAAGALIQTVSEIVPEGVAPEPIAIGLITLLDGNVLLSVFDPSIERAAGRDQAVDAFVSLIPIRDGLTR
ncbi:MAG: TetR/AcrR family transcriptional regulator [bacterium]|nr:TetR/AcrR family transcriptional regulator [bacterium]